MTHGSGNLVFSDASRLHGCVCFLTENKVESDFCEFFDKEPVESWLLLPLYCHAQGTNNRAIQKGCPKRKGIGTWKVERVSFVLREIKKQTYFKQDLLFISAGTVQLCKLYYLGNILCIHIISYSTSCMHKWQCWQMAQT